MREGPLAAGAARSQPLARRDLARWLLVGLLVLGAVLYTQRAYQYFLHDDEGGYAYAAWRISQGEVPYRDFLTPQLPVFLYWGGLLVGLFGRSFVVLRLATAAIMLLAAGLLFATSKELFGRRVALLSLGLFLVQPDAFHNARFFRPEAYMLLFQMAGLYCFVLGEKRGRLRYTALAGAFYGLSILSKLFGFLSLGGCFIYLLYAWWRERRPLRSVLLEGLALGLPVLALLGVVAALFMRQTPYFLAAVFEHHTMQGAALTVAGRLRKGLDYFCVYTLGQPLAVGLAALGIYSVFRRARALPTLLVWQAPTALSFLLMSRELQLRHLAYLAPALTTLVGVVLAHLLTAGWPVPTRRRRWLGSALALALAVGTVYPWIGRNARDAAKEEQDSPRITALIQSLSGPDDLVMSDYPGLNFLSGRKTTYWAAGLSGGAASSGQILGAALIDELERQNVSVVIIRTRGSDAQMTLMVDYSDFRRYVQAHFGLATRYDHTNETKWLEVYTRDDTMRLRPGLNYRDEVSLSGLRLAGSPYVGGSTVDVETRWQALQAMGRDYSVLLRLVDGSGHVWAEAKDPLEEIISRTQLETGYVPEANRGTSEWEAGQVVLLKHQLALSPTMPAGNYYLQARLQEPATGLVLPPARGTGAKVGGEPVITTVQLTGSSSLPQPEALPIATPLRLLAHDGLELFGTGALPSSLRAGETLGLSLYWQTGPAPAQDYRAEFLLLQGDVVRQQWASELAEGLPTHAWPTGEVVVGSYLLPLGRELPGGQYSLCIRLVDATGGLVVDEVEVVPDLALEPQLDTTALAGMVAHSLEGISFGGQIGLAGYELTAQELQAGESLELTLYWSCQEPPAKDYVVFVHLVDGNGHIVAQCDAMPGNYGAPTSGWAAGDALVDRYQVTLPAEVESGPLQVVVGLYDHVTGERLLLLPDGRPSGEDSVTLPVAVRVE